MGRPEVFGKIITKVFTAGLPVNNEVNLFHTASYPVEFHVYYLGMILLDSVICNYGVCLYGSGMLRMTKLVLIGTNVYCLFCIEEECPKLCFCYRCKNFFYDSGVDIDGTVDRWSGR